MSTARLSIDLEALTSNWRMLDAASGPGTETAAVVKADAYGLGADRVAPALAKAGARRFFVAQTEEGVKLRRILGPGPEINVLGGHMAGDAEMIGQSMLTPMINSIDQLLRQVEALPGQPFGIQLDTGMNRLGMEPGEWGALREIALAQNPSLIMSHLACADEPDHPMNPQQLHAFDEMTRGLGVPRSLSATGGILLGPDYHFEVTRPGIGIYGGRPFEEATTVIQLDLPVIQARDVLKGEAVGYGNAWIAPRPSRIATVSAGYADGVHRALALKDSQLYAGNVACPMVGRVSMDLITVDVTDLGEELPDYLSLINEIQTVDVLGDIAGTIGYELLTALGPRYKKIYLG